jgi:hypothetical protein
LRAPFRVATSCSFGELLAYIHSGTITEHLHRRFDSLEHRIAELQSTTFSLLKGNGNGGPKDLSP